MLEWLSHAFSTYILHSQHGNGYQWGSGGPGFLWIFQLCAYVTIAYQLVRRHNCHVHRCWRVSWHVGPDGHPVCKVHHPDHPARGLRSRLRAVRKWLHDRYRVR